MSSADRGELNPIYNDIIKDLTSKVEQVEAGLAQGVIPNRKDLEHFCWKTGRTARRMILPEKSEAREKLWGDCKGILKQVLEIERFNAGLFTSEAVKPDIIETDLLKMMKDLLMYMRMRKDGKAKIRSGEAPKKKAKIAEKKDQDDEMALTGKGGKGKGKKGGDKGQGKGKPGDDWEKAWEALPDRDERKKWDEDESDPDEPCPDKAKNGACSYSRQCGFCNK